VDALDLLACRRIWGLVAFGGDDGLGAFTAAGAVSGGTTVTEAPGISLQRHEVARPIQVFATLSEALPGVAVRRAKAGTAGGADGVCRWTGDRHRCGREGWLDVRREARIVGHHEVFWPFVHPGPAGEVATLEWKSDAARPVGEVALVVRYGFSMEAVRRLDGGPVRLTVALGDETVGRFEVPPREWRLWRRAWPVPASGTWPAVRITVEADAPGWRELLVEAAFVDRVPGEADGVPGWVDSGP
jgi:hypothetical protein